MNYVKRFLLVLLIAGLGTWGMYRLVLYSVRHYFVDFKRNEQTFLSKKENYNLLLLGSSRMLSTVNPKVLNDSLGCNAYNLGQNGASMMELNANLEGYLAARPAPRMVCMALDVHMLKGTKNFTFFPYYLTSAGNPKIAQALKDDGIKMELYRYMPFLSITEYGDYFKGALVKTALHRTELAPGDFQYQGYRSNGVATLDSQAFKTLMRNTKVKPVEITEEGKTALLELVKTCKEKNIKLVATYAPEYRSASLQLTSNSDSVLNFYRLVCRQYKVPFLENNRLPLNSNPALFANIGHVNKPGAERYTAILAGQIQNLFPNLFK